MLTLDQHRRVVLWYKDDKTVEEIPVTYYDGSFWDREMNEYTFAEPNKDYWDNFFRDERVRRTVVPSFDKNGNLKKNHNDLTMYEWVFIPYDMPKPIYDDMGNIRQTKEQWEQEVWNVCMDRYRKWKGA